MSIERRRSRGGRAFTLIEVMVATVITALVLGSVSMSLSQLGRAKSVSKRRFDAFLRADNALGNLRRDIASVVRTDDLFFTRFLLIDDATPSPLGEMDRDELLVFCTRLRPVRDIDNFTGEGAEYETQYRIETDDGGPVLWQRRDAFPDEYPSAGGLATPLVEGIVGLLIQAYDGEQWHDEWDSDEQGLPRAVSIAVTASGHRGADDVYDHAPVILRTVVAIDRVLAPRDIAEAEEEEARALEADLLDEEASPEEALEGIGGLPDGAGGTGGEEVPAPGDVVMPPGGGLGGGGGNRGGAGGGGSGRGGQPAGGAGGGGRQSGGGGPSTERNN